MKDHRPECFAPMCECDVTHFEATDCHFTCICPSLSACEQRVLGLNPVAAGVLIAQRARERALDAAREAVDTLRQSNYTGWEPWMLAGVCVDKALAAIDALRETT